MAPKKLLSHSLYVCYQISENEKEALNLCLSVLYHRDQNKLQKRVVF